MFSVIATLTRINAREKAGHEFARTVAFESLVVHGPGAYAVLCEGEASDDISPINDGRKGMRITLHNPEAAPGVAVLTGQERPATSRCRQPHGPDLGRRQMDVGTIRMAPPHCTPPRTTPGDATEGGQCDHNKHTKANVPQ